MRDDQLSMCLVWCGGGVLPIWGICGFCDLAERMERVAIVRVMTPKRIKPVKAWAVTRRELDIQPNDLCHSHDEAKAVLDRALLDDYRIIPVLITPAPRKRKKK